MSDFDEKEIVSMQKVSSILSKSGFYIGTHTMEQAFAKIQAGKEHGIGPSASLTSIHIVEGKIVLGAALIAAKIKASQKYDYRILKLDEKICEIEILCDGKPLNPISSFTIEEAEKAGLLDKKGGGWRKYPKDMLFARAIARAARQLTPDLFHGAVYVEGEIDRVEKEIKPSKRQHENNFIEGSAVNPEKVNLISEPTDEVTSEFFLRIPGKETAYFDSLPELQDFKDSLVRKIENSALTDDQKEAKLAIFRESNKDNKYYGVSA